MTPKIDAGNKGTPPRLSPTAAGGLTRGVRWLLGGYWLILVAATHSPQISTDDLPGVAGLPFDKLMHGLAFAGLAALLTWSRWWRERSWRFNALAAVGVGLVYGVVEEVTQPWFGRTRSGWDLLADAVGLVVGAGVAWGAVQLWGARLGGGGDHGEGGGGMRGGMRGGG